jgi:hypothetical protein
MGISSSVDFMFCRLCIFYSAHDNTGLVPDNIDRLSHRVRSLLFTYQDMRQLRRCHHLVLLTLLLVLLLLLLLLPPYMYRCVRVCACACACAHLSHYTGGLGVTVETELGFTLRKDLPPKDYE